MLRFHTHEILCECSSVHMTEKIICSIICIFPLCIVLKTAKLSTMSTCHLLTP